MGNRRYWTFEIERRRMSKRYTVRQREREFRPTLGSECSYFSIPFPQLLSRSQSSSFWNICFTLPTSHLSLSLSSMCVHVYASGWVCAWVCVCVGACIPKDYYQGTNVVMPHSSSSLASHALKLTHTHTHIHCDLIWSLHLHTVQYDPKRSIILV